MKYNPFPNCLKVLLQPFVRQRTLCSWFICRFKKVFKIVLQFWRYHSHHECSLTYFQSMIILILKWFKRNNAMAQRRAEKHKKIRISPKQQELYNRLKYSRLKSSKKWRPKEACHEMQSLRWSYGLWEVLQSDWRFFWIEMPFLRRDRWSGYIRESKQAKGLIPRMGIMHHWTSIGPSQCLPLMLKGLCSRTLSNIS